MSITLGELAVRFGCTLRGDPDVRVDHVAPLDGADPGAVTFLANPRFRRFLAQTQASVVVLDPRVADECPVAALLSGNPYATYARIAGLLHPAPAVVPGCHPRAAVDPTATVDPSACLGANAVIGARVRIGARCLIGPGCVVLDDAVVGADTRLTANVTICRGVSIGERCILHPGSVVGGDGFGFAPEAGAWVKVPQIGSVKIGNDVEIGSNTTVDRGAIGDTVISDGVKLDNQIQIGHNVRIGSHTVMAACSGVSGSTTIGERCMIAGQVGIAGWITICDDVQLTGRAFVSTSIHKPGSYSSGLTVDETVRFRKNAARFNRLDELARDVRRLKGERHDPEGDDDP